MKTPILFIWESWLGVYYNLATNGQCARFQIQQQVGPWSGTLVVFLGKTLYSHRSGVQMGTRKFNTGGSPVIDQHSIQRGIEYSQLLHAMETGMSSGLIGHVARMQTFPTYARHYWDENINSVLAFYTFSKQIKVTSNALLTKLCLKHWVPSVSFHIICGLQINHNKIFQ